ncbi:large ribosomal subunit protein uL18m-like [Saccoglossus kowalevskii]|uniref:39S ribosomal protein L18, mitochondrial-like n=1 Tax=Saccoglossus kowalevskii TaxID=10224 RepID=A0ABM0GWD9_SACKO|nr:PREDICTED: 39S ribosomal protein L18, mitochondrial-like [Saccoglossus kowalevskii]
MALNYVISSLRLWRAVCGSVCRQGCQTSCFVGSSIKYNSTNAAMLVAESDEDMKLSENDEVTKNFVNRNPRNLERMALQHKDKGWKLSHPRKDYWHKLILVKTNRHVSAYVEHITGHVPVSASSKEWAIKKYLYSCGDVVAVYNVGRVLAQRCLQAGIGHVHWHVTPQFFNTEKTQKFVEAMKEGGVVLNEPKSIFDFREPIEYFPDIDHDPTPPKRKMTRKEARRKRLSLDF